jgi:SAM-dependent methyltransferase/uncharacterized protein YbaR (Trm112 family)
LPDELDFHAMTACPACGRGPLARDGHDLACTACALGFPAVDEMPWLFPEPKAALAEWRARLHLLREHLAREARLHRRELARDGLQVLTRQRLGQLADAYEDHGRRLAELLGPLDLDSRPDRYEVHLALGTQLPSAQGLTSYYANVHRDWAWGEDENRAALDIVSGTLGTRGPARRMLVLGAGAGRLAYDLHQSGQSQLTIALDFNPLLSAIGRRVTSGETLQLYEFPIAPRSIADHAVLRTLSAPAPARPGLHFVLADGLAAPFAAGSFDVVLTPWFADIAPEDLAVLIRRINRLLAPDGRWLFFGSLAWADRAPASCYSLEELLALAPAAGLAPGSVQERQIPYMQSPASRHARLESVLAFAATKTHDAPPAPRRAARPPWIERTDLPVPALAEFREQSLSTRVYAFIMAMIDGQRSVEDMAALMQQQQLMTAADAVPAIQRFLERMHDDAVRRANF